MKLKQSSLDIYAFVALYSQELVGSFIKKVHQTGTNEFVLQIYRSDLKRRDLLISLAKGIAFFEQERPETPSNLSMMMRKNLSDRKILAVRQINFDRVVQIDLSGGIQIVLELFREGNIILLKDGLIEYAFNPREWKNRKIVHGHEYIPPSAVNPLEMDREAFAKTFAESKATIVQTLATRLNLGGEFSEEILFRLGEDKNQSSTAFSNIEGLLGTFRAVLAESVEGKGFFYKESDQVVPLRLTHLPEEPAKVFETFSEAISYYLANYPKEGEKETAVERRIKSIEKSIEEFSKQSQLFRQQGEYVFSHMKFVESLISELGKEERTLRPGESLMGKYPLTIFDPAKKICAISIEGLELRLKYNQKAALNGNAAFEESKSFLSKIDGARNILKELRSSRPENSAGAKRKQRRIFWFESFRWFFTSKGNLVVAGKDRKTNEKVVKKHMSQYDIYVHADLYGAPSTIVKGDGEKRPDEESLREACQFAVCNSRAWAAGQASGSAYWVFPEQVSKTPESGEYVSSGSWIIRGKRNYVFNLPLELYIGKAEQSGESLAMISPTPTVLLGKIVKIKPGETKKPLSVREISKTIGIDIEEVERLLPPGNSDLITEGSQTGSAD